MKESIILITRGYASESEWAKGGRGGRESGARERGTERGKKAEENAPFSGDHFNFCPLLSSFPTPKDKPERQSESIGWGPRTPLNRYWRGSLRCPTKTAQHVCFD